MRDPHVRDRRATQAVELTYGNHLWSAIGAGVRIGVAPTDRWLCCLPLHHVGGLAIVLRSALYRTGSCSSGSTRRRGRGARHR